MESQKKEVKHMENFEKVEKLSKMAHISFTQAKRVLEDNNWDLVDAMVALEKEGKTMDASQKVKEKLHTAFQWIKSTSFVISKDGQVAWKLPVWLGIFILVFAWHISIVALVAGLVFGYRYTFVGQNVSGINGMIEDLTNQMK